MRLDITGFTLEEVYELMLTGLESRRLVVSGKIAELQAQLGLVKRGPGRPPSPPAVQPLSTNHKRKHNLSPEARRNIVLAQKRRWAQVRKAQKTAQGKMVKRTHKSKPAPPADESLSA